MLKRVNWAKSLIMLFLSFALCVGFVGTGSAQPDKDTQQKQPAQKQKQKMGPTMGTMKSGDAQKLKQMQQEMKKLQKKLGKIKKQALEENKGLKKKEQNLKNFIQKKMDKNMADKDVDNARMDEIRKEIRENKDMEQSKKGELIKEYKKNAKGY